MHSHTKTRPHYLVLRYNEATLRFKQRKQISCFLHHINCPSKGLLEWMKLIEANIILLFVLQSYLSSPYRSNFMRDFSSSVRMHKSFLMSSFMKHLQRSVKFWRHRKKWVVHCDSKLQGQEWQNKTFYYIFQTLNQDMVSCSWKGS